MSWMWKTSSEAEKEHKTASFWKQSGASLRMSEGRENTAERGRRTDDRGRELRRLENAYGKITFYAVDGQRIGIEAARTGVWQEDSMQRARQQLDRNRTFPVRMEGGKGYTDSHHKEEGAFLWSETADLSGERIMNELRRLSVQLRQETLSELMPEAVKECRIHGHLPLFHKIEESVKKSLQEIRQGEEKPAPFFFESLGSHKRQEQADKTEADNWDGEENDDVQNS